MCQLFPADLFDKANGTTDYPSYQAKSGGPITFDNRKKWSPVIKWLAVLFSDHLITGQVFRWFSG
jgi:hypothetical protein